jgi:hypothetical protein
MAKKQREPKPYDGRPLQFSDLSEQGQQIMSSQMAEVGLAKTGVPIARERIQGTIDRAQTTIDDPKSSADKVKSASRTLKKAESSKQNLDAIQDTLRDEEVTLDTAAQNRIDLTRGSAERAVREAPSGLGGGSRLRAAGATWYFDHHQELKDHADRHGIETDRLITASSVMSPQNSPENEKAAASALAELHSSNPTLGFSKKAQKALGVGGSVSYSDLTSQQAGKLGAVELRDHIEGVDVNVLERQAKGGAHKEVSKAIDVIRGNTSVDDAINPHSSPKVWSYNDSIAKAVPGNDAHQEYLSRADNTLFQIPGQQRLDLHGLKDSKEGILSPTKSTAEDTWQGALSSRQQLEAVPVPGSVHAVSPAKFVASDSSYTGRVGKTAEVDGKNKSALPDAQIGATALVHAWHNEATIRSAQQLSDSSGEIVPSVLPQATGWTEGRRVAKKDPDYRKLNTGQFSTSTSNEVEGQMRLF